MSILLILFTTFTPSLSTSLTSTHEPLWRRGSPNGSDAPDLRTTQDIVWSCIATIFACAWVAIHPNLPDPLISGWSRFKHRTGVMIIALFAPEFILIWALRQRIGAESIMKEYNRTILGINGGQKSIIHRAREWFHVPPPPPNGPVWTLAHGFYMQMGGFLFYDGETAQRVLYFEELLKLVQSGTVDRPNVTEEYICDRSKGDFLTKSFVVVQTTWFIVQCIGRWAAKLPVTELEVMTLAFAVMNIITYRLWWEKPQNVCVGVRIQMRKGVVEKQQTSEEHQTPEEQRDVKREWVTRVHMLGEGRADVWPTAEEMDITDTDRVFYGFHPLEIRDLLSELEAIQARQGISPEPDDPTWTNEPHQQIPLPVAPPHSTWKKIRAATGRFLRSLGRGIWRSALFRRLLEVVLGSQQRTTVVTSISQTTVLGPAALKVGSFYAYDAVYQKTGLIAFAVASGSLFGGLHLIPWKFTFPTHTESLLWRISALYITLNPILLSLPLLVVLLIDGSSYNDWFRRTAIRYIRPYWVLQPFRVIALTLPLYILARILIIVLAFMGLRSLPPDAYKEVSWSSFVPHI